MFRWERLQLASILLERQRKFEVTTGWSDIGSARNEYIVNVDSLCPGTFMLRVSIPVGPGVKGKLDKTQEREAPRNQLSSRLASTKTVEEQAIVVGKSELVVLRLSAAWSLRIRPDR